jgi:hypothetical protein
MLREVEEVHHGIRTFMSGIMGPYTTVAVDLGGNIDADPMFVEIGD